METMTSEIESVSWPSVVKQSLSFGEFRINEHWKENLNYSQEESLFNFLKGMNEILPTDNDFDMGKLVTRMNVSAMEKTDIAGNIEEVPALNNASLISGSGVTKFMKDGDSGKSRDSNEIDEPNKIIYEPAIVVNDATKIIYKPTKILDEPTQLIAEPVKIIVKPSNIIDKHAKILDEPGKILDEPGKILDEPGKILDEPGNCQQIRN